MEYLFLLARILFGGYFLLSGINHFRHLGNMTGYAQSKKVPAAKAGVVVSGILFALGGIGIIIGLYPTIAVILIIVALLPVTFMMHNFWAVQDPGARQMEQIGFMKNIALIGGALAFLFISQPWMLSVWM